MKKTLLIAAACVFMTQASVFAYMMDKGCCPGCEKECKAGDMGKMHDKKLEKMTRDLGLSAEQKDKISAIMKERAEKRQAEMERMRESMKTEKEETQKSIKAILNPEQVQKYDKLQAERMEKAEKMKQKKMEKKGKKGMMMHGMDN